MPRNEHFGPNFVHLPTFRGISFNRKRIFIKLGKIRKKISFFFFHRELAKYRIDATKRTFRGYEFRAFPNISWPSFYQEARFYKTRENQGEKN
jgi:hypothetical protein